MSSALGATLPDIVLECYTDSTVALYWIRGTKKEWKPFIQNRVNEIREKTSPDLYRHCSGATNPGDLPSRGMMMTELRVSSYGPDWLKDSPPPPLSNGGDPTEMPDECFKELKANSKKTHNLVATKANGEIMACGRFNSFRRLVRVMAYVIRAVKAFKRREDSQSSCPLST